jgi:hypothetical protein
MTDSLTTLNTTPAGPDRMTLDPAARRVAIALLVIFIATIGVMFLLRADPNWDRLVYMFGGLEAIVFAAAGALFGTTVQRGAVTTARAEAEQARDDANQAMSEARSSAADAAKGKALAAMIKAADSEVKQPDQGYQVDDQRRGGRPDVQLGGSAPPPEPTLRAMARVAGELFPDKAEAHAHVNDSPGVPAAR